jgi:hypothetical protein
MQNPMISEAVDTLSSPGDISRLVRRGKTTVIPGSSVPELPRFNFNQHQFVSGRRYWNLEAGAFASALLSIHHKSNFSLPRIRETHFE